MQYTGPTLEGLVFRKFSLHQEKTDLKMQYTGRTLEGLVFRKFSLHQEEVINFSLLSIIMQF